jgi:hypothetical protein
MVMFNFGVQDAIEDSWWQEFVDEFNPSAYHPNETTLGFASAVALERVPEVLQSSDNDHDLGGGQSSFVEYDREAPLLQESIIETADTLRVDAWQHVVDLYTKQGPTETGRAVQLPFSIEYKSPAGNPFTAAYNDVDLATVGSASFPTVSPANVGPPDGAGPPNRGGGGNNTESGDSGSGGATGPVATYTSGEVGSADYQYNITYNFYGTSADWGLDGSGPDLAAAFVNTANYLTSFIIENDASGIDSDLPEIDDIWINVTLESIDGSGGVLASAGPEIIRGTLDDPGLPLQGSMTFDIADAVDLYDTNDPSSAFNGLSFEENLWDDVVLHETLHVLGLGTLWDLYGLSTVDDNGTKRPWDDTLDYTGSLAETEAGGDLLIETDGGSGTAGGHWDEDMYGNELMTGAINGEGNYLAAFSIAALADLGYEIVDNDYEAAALGTIDLSMYGGSYQDVDVLIA